MNCPKCGKENKETEKFCFKCGAELRPTSWKPDWKWHLKVLAGIYLLLSIIYFLLTLWLK